MPRASAGSGDVVPFTVAAAPMPPPAELNAEEAQYWHDSFPGQRFGADDRVLLVELVRHQHLSRRMNVELDGLRQLNLTGTTARDSKVRTMFTERERARTGPGLPPWER